MNDHRPVNGVRRFLASLNSDGTQGWALLGLCALLLLPVLAGEPGRAALRYDRTALAAGEWWRLLSAHIVHLDFEHAVLNSLGLVLMWALFASDYRPRQWLVIMLVSVAAIDAGLWLRDSTVAWYVGSSGALHGMMAAGTLAQWVGALPFSDSHAGVVVDAHLFGAVAGALVAACIRPRPH
jgi:membrane associated rhomboid family serine protease